MEKQDLKQYINSRKATINDKIRDSLRAPSIPPVLHESMNYSLFAGGKRLRPILLVASYESFASQIDKTYQTAVALEMIHTYSLIHDDLPAMDDDEYRRGKLTNHRKFDEATAILAGDGLLTYSFELISQDEQLTASEKVFLIQELAKASGPEGMVGGQVLDLAGENTSLTLADLEQIHQLKTGRLITFAIIAGAYLAKVSEQQRVQLAKFGHYLGLIFQVQDDILDVIGDSEKIGKPVGSDELNEKSTYPSLLGLEGAIEKKNNYVHLAETALKEANPGKPYLHHLLQLFHERDH